MERQKNTTVLRFGQGRPQEESTVLHLRLKMNKVDRTFLESVFDKSAHYTGGVKIDVPTSPQGLSET